MKILLLGEYSNVHWTLAEGLRQLGHYVTVVSDGDGWKNYPRDISLKRQSNQTTDSLKYLLDVVKLWPKLRNYDVVQLINPVFLSFKAEKLRPFYKMLRHQNRSVFLGAFGMDYYWVKAGTDCQTFRYSDFNMGSQLRHSEDNDAWKRDWLHGPKGVLNQYIAEDCNGIISGLYEYDASYRPYFPQKLKYIPFPICPDPDAAIHKTDKVKFFIGIQRLRSVYKGTDIMLHALERLEKDLPNACEVRKAESVPFEEYSRMLHTSDVMLDQLYSYTPAMNALLGMAKGMVIVGGGEPENYEILHEDQLRPIVNVEPNEEIVYQALRHLALHPELIEKLSGESIEYINRHHHYIKVARQYVEFWTHQMSNNL